MTPMTFEDLERAYETIARAIDQAGPRNEALFLTKLALTLAHQSGDSAAFARAIETALADLPLDHAPSPHRSTPSGDR